MLDLSIIRSSHAAGPVKGGQDMIILCQKVKKGKIFPKLVFITKLFKMWFCIKVCSFPAKFGFLQKGIIVKMDEASSIYLH
jgi:hypothetical protein